MRISIYRLLSLLLLVLVLFPMASVIGQEVNTTEEVVELLRDLRKIHTPNGIEVLEQVELNGERQWISIRGKDKSNPVLLVLHGGPASPMMPLSWAFQGPWEDYFTVVQWDQRAVGKNWLSTDTLQIAETLQFRNLIQDAYVLVDHLRERLNQEKIFLMGYSYGSAIGIRMAARIPQKLHGYIGIGQMAPGNPEEVIYQTLLELAEKAQNTEALEELKSIAPYPNPGGPNGMRKILTVRKWARYFNGGWYGKPDFNLLFSLPQLTSEYTKEEVKSLDVSSPWISQKILAKGGGGDFPVEFQIPVIFMMGRYDLHTPYESVKAYYSQIKAPVKQLNTFNQSGHLPFLEEQGRFLVTLVEEVFPLSVQN